MFTDLFSHKIHSSGNEWPDKLVELAFIFQEFDGKPWDRDAIIKKLTEISPRVTYIGSEVEAVKKYKNGRKDLSKFRDEITAYPSYLGLYFVEKTPDGWIFRLSQTVKTFLLREEPDVASFLKLQLLLFQYPNAHGASYSKNGNAHFKPNALDRTLSFIENNVHLSPLRLTCCAIMASAALEGVCPTQTIVTVAEIFALANHPNVNTSALPKTAPLKEALRSIRQGKLSLPKKFENRFHILMHTGLFEMTARKRAIKLREPLNDPDKALLLAQLDCICTFDKQFEGFDNCKNGKDMAAVLCKGEWSQYFDAIHQLPTQVKLTLTADPLISEHDPETVPTKRKPAAATYPFKERTNKPPKISKPNRKSELIDPEVTNIRRQRRNLAHKELIDKMEMWLKGLGVASKENEHIDLFAKLPSKQAFIFEMKSGGESLLEQIRKGLSQLYEYRYRYKDQIGYDNVSLCLVLPEQPQSIPWVTEYLCDDREINICWFDANNRPEFPVLCNEQMKNLIPNTT